MQNSMGDPHRPDRAQRMRAVVVVSFGAAVAMWCCGYVGRLPVILLPAEILLALLILCLVAGGFAAGSCVSNTARGGWLNGALSGLLTSTINLLVLGSLLVHPDEMTVRPNSALWLAGYLSLGVLLGAAGGALATLRRTGAASGRAVNWQSRFAIVGVIATFFLIVLGGLVTSKDAGMAVPDWPTSFRANMFLYPLSRMTGDIYYEHAHRLFGALVGLISLALCVFLIRTGARRPVLNLAFFILALVTIQGILGGMRVLQNDTRIAVVHGVGAQFILSLFVTLAAWTSRTWCEPSTHSVTSAKADRALLRWLLAASLLQLTLGALLRHRGQEYWLLPHIGGAIVVVVLAAICGMRAALAHRDSALLRRLGVALLVGVLLQFLLGLSAFAATRFAPRESAEVVLATSHQVAGSAYFATVVLLCIWGHRLRPAESAAENLREAARPS